MQAVMRGYIRGVDAVNYRLGRVMMYGIFALMGVLLWSSISKTFFVPTLWTLEMAQFVMVGYYILGGPMRCNWVRMCAWTCFMAAGASGGRRGLTRLPCCC